MADPEEGKGFTPQMLARAEMDYRRFLHLHILYPGMELVPTKMIDEVWHQHILTPELTQETARGFSGTSSTTTRTSG